MKACILFLLALPLLARAQRPEFQHAFERYKPDSMTVPIHLPRMDYNPNFNLPSDAGMRNPIRVSMVRDDSTYRKVFWRHIYNDDSLKKYRELGVDHWMYRWAADHHADSLPAIDFNKYELMLYAACTQCLAICNLENGHRSCHRNACNYYERWYVREKKR